ncbi:MAG: hypothetical protein M3Q62_07700 [Actinomycetota bacterium]|nr:hypothetical protein [Rubrobacteraceae bacterium]MBA3635141.1 hypothetical protein [Rubrobacteraceae bacterium]MDQ3183412.1 hypothetical protein [Actinomycetota bacterium]MDQ3497210.1 hypothetical protein [Actinomycetota bacterium]
MIEIPIIGHRFRILQSAGETGNKPWMPIKARLALLVFPTPGRTSTTRTCASSSSSVRR